MKCILLVTSFVLFFAVNCEGGKARVNKDESANVEKLLQGTWGSIWSNVSSCKIDEKVYFTFKKSKVPFKKSKVQIVYKKGIDPEKAKFKVIPSETPETGKIDIISPPTKNETEPSTLKGLYVLKENTLVLFLARDGEPRPKKISAFLKADEDVWFLILVKEK